MGLEEFRALFSFFPSYFVPYAYHQMCYTRAMDTEILQKLQTQDEKLELIYQSVEKTRKYFLWTLIATVVMFVLPLIGLMFAVPFFINTLSSAYGI